MILMPIFPVKPAPCRHRPGRRGVEFPPFHERRPR